MSIRSVLAFFLLLSPFSIAGAANQPETGFRIGVDVELVSTEVAALDREGRPIRGLQKEDFELYEDGKRQEIVSLDEITRASSSSSLGVSPLDTRVAHLGKTVLIMFNFGYIETANHQLTRDTAERFVMKHMGPNDLFAVGFFGVRTTLVGSLSRDREEVLSAIRRPLDENTHVGADARGMLRALERISLAIAPVKGTKSILIFSQYEGGGYPEKIHANALTAARNANVVFHSIRPGLLHKLDSVSAAPTFPGLRAASGGPALSSYGAWALTTVASELARKTGGFSIQDALNLDAPLDDLAIRLGNYYILGFRSDNPRHDGGFRKLRVKTKRKGIALKHRPGYQDRRPIDVLASSKQEKALLTALATPDIAPRSRLSMRAAYFYESAQTAKALVLSRLALEDLVLSAKGKQIGADVNVMGVAYAEDGGIAARFSETIPLRFEKGEEAAARHATLPYRNYFRLRPGKYRIRLAVSDESDHLATAEQRLEIPEFQARRLSTSSLLIAEQVSELPEVIRKLELQLMDESDPLLYSRMDIEPSIDNRRARGKPVDALFRIYNVSESYDGRDLMVAAKIIDGRGVVAALPPFPLANAFSRAAKGEAAVALRLPFEKVAVGKYRLVIELTGAHNDHLATIETDLEFI